jgi:hypothetical protein
MILVVLDDLFACSSKQEPVGFLLEWLLTILSSVPLLRIENEP